MVSGQSAISVAECIGVSESPVIDRRFVNQGKETRISMIRVLGVHGIAQQVQTESTLHKIWAPALCGGVQLAGGNLTESEVGCVLYGDLFRPTGRRLSLPDATIKINSLDSFEMDLLYSWWHEAARVDSHVVSPSTRTLARAPRTAQSALRALSRSRYFAGASERAMLGNLRQVRRYFSEPEIRAEAIRRVAALIDENVRVIVGHSLGSVVAYEALCFNSDWPVRRLVTVGSPLGIRNLIFDRLQPKPQINQGSDGKKVGAWPGPGRTWANLADESDVVALVKDLRPLFGPAVRCWIVNNGARAHDVIPYLTAKETGSLISAYL